MATASISVVVEGDTYTSAPTVTEKFELELRLAGLASDTSLTLGTLTNPKYLVVAGEAGVSFKLGGAGADAVNANPVAVLTEEQLGRALTAILLSNSQPSECTVKVYAGE